MSEYVIITDTSADIPASVLDKGQIHLIPMVYQLNGEEHPHKDPGSWDSKAFYDQLRNGGTGSTSQISPAVYTDYFEPFLKEGKDILHLCLSSGISGVINSALAAQKELAEKYPERKIYVVDSLGASSGYGLLMDQLADLRDEGMSIEELAAWAEEHKLEMNHWFFSTDLKFYIKGGRISKTAGFVGGMLGICPLLNMDDAGRLIPRAKIRSKRKVIQAIVDKMEECAKDGLDYSGKCYISQSACMEDAKAVASLVEQRFPKLSGKVEINYVGTTIGSHTGPGTVALFFWGKKREA